MLLLLKRQDSDDSYELEIFEIGSLDLQGVEALHLAGLKIIAKIVQGLLYTWTDRLGTFLATFVVMKISKKDSNIICRSSKNITFSKIWRLLLKN